LEGISIYLNDTANRVYTIFACAILGSPQLNPQSTTYLLDTNNLTVYASYTGGISTYPSSYTKTIYDSIGSRIFYVYPNLNVGYMSVDEVFVTSTTFTYIKYVFINDGGLYVTGGIFNSGNLYIWGYTSVSVTFSSNIYTFEPYSSYQNTDVIDPGGKIPVCNGYPYNTSTPENTPPFQGNLAQGNLAYIPFGIYYSSASLAYTIYESRLGNGSALIQLPLPIPGIPIVPRTLILFDQQFLIGIATDELKGIAFISTEHG